LFPFKKNIAENFCSGPYESHKKVCQILKVLLQECLETFNVKFNKRYLLLGISFEKNLTFLNLYQKKEICNIFRNRIVLFIIKSMVLYSLVVMGSDPTRAYFWPTVNKRLTCLWPGYFLTQSKGKKFAILWGYFPNPNSNHGLSTRPGSKNFDPHPSLLCSRNPVMIFPINTLLLIDGMVAL